MAGSGTGSPSSSPAVDPATTAIKTRVTDLIDIKLSDSEVDATIDRYVDNAIQYIKAQIVQDRFPWVRQGFSQSVASPIEDLTSLANNEFLVSIDGSGAQEIELTLANCGSGALTAAEMQTQIRAEFSAGQSNFWSFNNTIVVFSGGLYIVTSPTYSSRSVVKFFSASDEREVIGAMGLSPLHGGIEQPGQERDEMLEEAAARVVVNMYRETRLRPELLERGVTISGLRAGGFQAVDEFAQSIIQNRRPLIV
jgi:hypothetical protein